MNPRMFTETEALVQLIINAAEKGNPTLLAQQIWKIRLCYDGHQAIVMTQSRLKQRLLEMKQSSLNQRLNEMKPDTDKQNSTLYQYMLNAELACRKMLFCYPLDPERDPAISDEIYGLRNIILFNFYRAYAQLPSEIERILNQPYGREAVSLAANYLHDRLVTLDTNPALIIPKAKEKFQQGAEMCENALQNNKYSCIRIGRI